MITELRRYRIKPGRMESWVAFFREAARRNEAGGSPVEYAGIDRESSTFVWLRSYADEADRVARKDAFYGADWWTQNEAFAMDHVLEYDVVYLEAALRRVGELIGLEPSTDPDRPGCHADRPPDGWTASTRRTFVPG